MTVAGLKIWPLFIAMGTAAAAAGVTVWAAYGTHDLNIHPAERPSESENGARDDAGEEAERALSDGSPMVLAANLEGLEDGEQSASSTRLAANPLPDCAATRYARALQEGRADEVIRMTHWMQKRLQRVRLSCSAPADEEGARAELRRDILTRTLEGNRLRPEGVKDKYIFAPGAKLSVVGSDKGEHLCDGALSCPVKERTWLRVVYPNPVTALRDEMGRPIRSIVVGVNISDEGYVVKAGVLGNLEIRYDTISMVYDD
ncbi:MAG: hypothetical protein R6V12_20515 [Candidatus Hydrogenedentota bacterium]